MRVILLCAMLLSALPAFGQQTLDPALLPRLLATARADRNVFLDALNEAQAREAQLAERLAAAEARIKQLEPKPEAPESSE